MALRVPPVLVVLSAGLLIWALARATRELSWPLPASELVAGLLFVVGVAICVLGVAAFRQAKTTVNPLQPEQAATLVTQGIYRVSRNPMYLGFALILVAWVVYLSVWPGLLVVAIFILYINHFQIAPEERALQTRFGQAFLAYKNSVRRWL